MSLLFVADLHYALKQFDWLIANASRYDPVIIGGDLLDLGSALETDVQIVVIKKYLDRLRQATRLVVSSGNHDGDRHDIAGESVAGWIAAARAPQLSVDGDCLDISGTVVTVCPWWDGPRSRATVEALLMRDAARPKSRWIWVHHAPPDRSPVSWTGRRFGGDEFLVNWIEIYQPDLVLSGHIHPAPFYAEGSWIDRLGKTWVFNPGKQPGPRPTYLVIDLEKMTASWVSAEGDEFRVLSALAQEPPKGDPARAAGE